MSPDPPTPDGVSQPEVTETLPRAIGRYEIRRELGRGMMGIVYEALDPALGRTIALKTIQLTFSLKPEERETFEQRFLVEARTAARLSHPGIVVVHDVGRDAETGMLYMALEHLKGRTLGEILREGTLTDWREALRIIGRIADALHHAHSERVIHRDVKPANIMILPSGEPKIMDFGIAKIETARIKLTMAGESFGTPLYMSPEQALGHNLDARTDLFSLGSIAYSLLTGRLAFEAENMTRIIARVIREDPPPPSHVVRHLPPEVDYLVARALAKSPADRYPTGKTMAEDIEDVLAGRPPRHRSGWNQPRRAEGTMVSMPTLAPEDWGAAVLGDAERLPLPPAAPADVETVIDTLVSGLTAPPEPSAVTAPTGTAERPRTGQAPARSRAAAATASRERRPARVAPARPEGRRNLWPLLLAIGFAALIVPVAFLLPRQERTSPPASTLTAPSTSPAALAPPPSLASPDAPATLSETSPPGQDSTAPQPPNAAGPAPKVQAPAAPEPSATPPATLSSPATKTGTAQLAFDFEHSLKAGMLRVFIDSKLVVEEDLEGRVTKKVAGIKFRKGRIEDLLSLSPGKHEVRVEVAWEDNLKEETLSGTFQAGVTRQLEIRLGRIRKNLSLEWK